MTQGSSDGWLWASVGSGRDVCERPGTAVASQHEHANTKHAQRYGPHLRNVQKEPSIGQIRESVSRSMALCSMRACGIRPEIKAIATRGAHRGTMTPTDHDHDGETRVDAPKVTTADSPTASASMLGSVAVTGVGAESLRRLQATTEVLRCMEHRAGGSMHVWREGDRWCLCGGREKVESGSADPAVVAPIDDASKPSTRDLEIASHDALVLKIEELEAEITTLRSALQEYVVVRSPEPPNASLDVQPSKLRRDSWREGYALGARAVVERLSALLHPEAPQKP